MKPPKKSKDVYVPNGIYFVKDLSEYFAGKTLKEIQHPQGNPELSPYQVRFVFTDRAILDVYAESGDGYAGSLEFDIPEPTEHS